jgi:hypothetical protein
MKHKHSEVIKAWADGAEIEEYRPNLNQWIEPEPYPIWDARFSYRIKPEPLKEPNQLNIRISQLENQLQACRKLIDEKDEKIVELSIKLSFANRNIEILNEEEPQYLYVYRNKNSNNALMSAELLELKDWVYMGKVRVEK